ncbi:glycosyltransferase [Motilibacter deserti]|uniref:glycosyltransferase n=1 Tax=Motilibacter deserti TaxID=2714956 RepID=UPI002F2B8818
MSDSSAFAAIVPAHDEGDRVAATVRAIAALPGVDLVVVVDDGSSDSTAALAEEAGAVVVRHGRNRGKAAALESGAELVRALDRREGVRRHLLLLDADLGATAVGAAPLLAPVAAGEADMTIGVLPPQTRPDGSAAGGHGFVVKLAADGIRQATGWEPRQPLSGQRALTREAFEAGLPLAAGFGVEAGLTVDLLRRGLRVREVDVDLGHRATGNDWRGQLHRAQQWRDVYQALRARGAFPAWDTTRDVAARVQSIVARLRPRG